MRSIVAVSIAVLAACAGSQSGTGLANLDDPASCFVKHPVTGVIPIPVKRVDPLYPAQARQNGITGEVVLQGSIGPSGEVVGATVVESSPPGVFDAASLSAFRQWRYCPPTPEIPYPETFKTRLRFAR